ASNQLSRAPAQNVREGTLNRSIPPSLKLQILMKSSKGDDRRVTTGSSQFLTCFSFYKMSYMGMKRWLSC
ncbi:mCG1043095, partial [Mus musculus]